mgnify:CR=1 FL=1
MPTIIYIMPDGTRNEVEVENGYSVMEGAINNNIDGKHQLTCQIKEKDDLDGLVILVADNEY